MRLAGKENSLHLLETMCEKTEFWADALTMWDKNKNHCNISLLCAFVTLHQVLHHSTLSYKFSGLIMANIVEQSQPSIS
jgi:hypothetical protein